MKIDREIENFEPAWGCVYLYGTQTHRMTEYWVLSTVWLYDCMYYTSQHCAGERSAKSSSLPLGFNSFLRLPTSSSLCIRYPWKKSTIQPYSLRKVEVNNVWRCVGTRGQYYRIIWKSSGRQQMGKHKFIYIWAKSGKSSSTWNCRCPAVLSSNACECEQNSLLTYLNNASASNAKLFSPLHRMDRKWAFCWKSWAFSTMHMVKRAYTLIFDAILLHTIFWQKFLCFILLNLRNYTQLSIFLTDLNLTAASVRLIRIRKFLLLWTLMVLIVRKLNCLNLDPLFCTLQKSIKSSSPMIWN